MISFKCATSCLRQLSVAEGQSRYTKHDWCVIAHAQRVHNHAYANATTSQSTFLMYNRTCCTLYHNRDAFATRIVDSRTQRVRSVTGSGWNLYECEANQSIRRYRRSRELLRRSVRIFWAWSNKNSKVKCWCSWYRLNRKSQGRTLEFRHRVLWTAD